MITNPYQPPPLGSDDPHEGIDLAVLSPGTGIALTGAPLQAALSGIVAAVLAERFPYGNALIIETPLDGLPESWIRSMQLPQPIPTLAPHRSLTCPQAGLPTDWPVEPRSLYLVYAHMLEPPAFQVGDAVSCGDALGAVGASGNALNPHLHLEARVGPAGRRFASLAHYDTSATPLEMQSYCVWRVSGWFQLLDPMQIFASDQ
jgi:murein DD-endopeptidase MepM/ murein hydrolase activator NlpD